MIIIDPDSGILALICLLIAFGILYSIHLWIQSRCDHEGHTTWLNDQKQCVVHDCRKCGKRWTVKAHII